MENLKRALHPLRGTAKRLARLGAAVAGPQRWRGREPRLWVLMYHRVLPADDPRARLEEPGMQVTPETFRRHLRWIKETFQVLRLSDWVERAAGGGPLPTRACAVTFDDGWRDNFEHALPILQDEQVPATVFAVSHMIGTRERFWPNRLARILDRDLQPLRDHPAFQWLQALHPGALDKRPDPEQRSSLIAACKQWDDETLHRRLDEMEQALGLAPLDKMEQALGLAPLDEMEQALDLPHLDQPDLMSWAELRQMADSGLVEVGSHTCRHARLNEQLPADRMAEEIRASRARLEQELGRPVALFCYPNGDYTPQAEALVAETYAAAVTTERGINRTATPRLRLRRIGLHEDVARTRIQFMARLSGWV